MRDTRIYEGAVLALYEAATEPERLPHALRLAASCLGAEIFSLEQFSLSGSGTLQSTGVRIDSRISQELLDAYGDYLTSAPHPRADFVKADLYSRNVYSDLEMGDRATLAASSFHQELLGRFGIPYAYFGLLTAQEPTSMSFSIHFEKIESLQDRSVRRQLDGFLGHLAQLDGITARLRPDSATRDHANQQGSRTGTAYLDRRGVLLDVEGEAVALLESAGGRPVPGHKLRLESIPLLDDAIRTMADWWMRPDKSSRPKTVFETGSGVTLAILPTGWISPGRPDAVLKIHLSADAHTGLIDFLSAHDLSDSERALCHHLLGFGNSVATFAAMRGTSVGTVRVQAKSAMGKLGVRSQLDLVRLLYAVRFSSDITALRSRNQT
jgi:DNA-binding CsgD family transcriptional regulator